VAPITGVFAPDEGHRVGENGGVPERRLVHDVDRPRARDRMMLAADPRGCIARIA
jgi:hypothetical protein